MDLHPNMVLANLFWPYEINHGPSITINYCPSTKLTCNLPFTANSYIQNYVEIMLLCY